MTEELNMTFVHGTQIKCFPTTDMLSSFRQYLYFSSITAYIEGLLRGRLQLLDS
jgi:hypothetical protein